MAADGGPSTAALDEALKPFQERASEAEVRPIRFSPELLTTCDSRRSFFRLDNS
jgi:hypothetical protein